MTRSLKHILLMALLLLPLWALADVRVELTSEERAYLEQLGPITVCPDPDWQPFTYLDEQGHPVGIAIDLLSLIEERLGIRFTYVKAKDWDEAVGLSKAGEVLILPFSNKTPAREEWLIFTEPLLVDPNVFVTREGHPFISDALQLIDETIVFPPGTAMEERVRRAFPNLTVVHVPSENDVFRAVDRREADMTLRSLTMAAYTIRKEGLFNLKIAGQAPDEFVNRLRMCILKSEPMLRDILDKGIATITAREREEVVNRHVNITVVTPMDYGFVLRIAAVLTVFIALSFFWNWRLNISKKALEESERSKSVLIANLPGMAYRCRLDRNWTMEFVSDGCKALTGYAPDEIIENRKLSYNELVAPEYREGLWQKWQQGIAERRALQLEYEIITASGARKWVWEQGIPVIAANGEVLALEGLILDVSGRKEAEERNQQHASLQQLLLDISSSFIQASPDNMDRLINTMLGKCGVFLQVDRTFLFQFSEDEQYMSNTHEWCAPGVEPVNASVQHYPVAEVPLIAGIIRSRAPLIIPDVEELPEGPDKRELQKQQVQSVLCLPIVNNDLLLGYFGFDNVVERRTLDGEQVQMLRVMGNILGDALMKARFEREIRASQEKYRMLTENATDVIWVLDVESDTFRYMSPSVKRLRGYTAEEVMQQGLAAALTPSSLEYLRTVVPGRLARFRQGQTEFFHDEIEQIHKDGHTVWTEVNARYLENPVTGRIEATGATRDITLRKKAEEELLASERRAIIQRKALAELTINRFFIETDITQAFQHITKTVAETLDVVRTSIWTFNENDSKLTCVALYERDLNTFSSGMELTASDCPRYFKAIMEDKRTYAEDAQNDERLSDLTESYLKPMGITSMLDAGIMVEGRMVGIFCSEHIGPKRKWHADEESFESNISALISQFLVNVERKKSAEIIHAAEQNHRILLDNIQTQVWYLTDDHTYGAVNQAHAEFNGLKIEDLAFKNMYDIFPGDIVEVYRQGNAQVFATGKPVNTEEWVPHVSGERRLISIAKVPKLRDDGSVEYIVCSAEDITDLKRVAEALKQSESKLRNLFDHAPAGIFHSVVGGRFLSANPALSEMLGYSCPEELIAATTDMTTQIYADPNLRPQIMAALMKTDDWVHYDEVVWRRKDQRLITVSMSGRKVRDVTGAVAYLEGFIVDITTRKRAEAERLEAYRNLEQAIERANTMALLAESANIAKSEFLANMSHEIRTPMNAIIGFADLLAQNIPDERQRGQAAVIARSGHMLLRLLNDVLDLSKIEAGKISVHPQVFAPASLLQEIGQMFELRAADKGIALALGPTDHLPPAVWLDEARVRQILINLVGNAVKFTDEGHVDIEVESRPIPAQPHADAKGPGSAVAPQGTVELRFIVTDTGIGIPDDFKACLFNPFEQAPGQDHARYGGTGLGLAISMRLARLMNGEISVADHPEGQGSVFTLILRDVPIADTSSILDPATTDETACIAFQQKTLILIADDSTDNLDLLKTYLEPYAFPILEAADGIQALELIKSRRPGLVLTDIKMPGMSGYELLKRVREDDLLASLPIIAITASVVGVNEHSFEGHDFDGVLIKPLKKSDLIREMARFIPHDYQGNATITAPGREVPGGLPETIVIPAALRAEIADDVAQLQVHLRVNVARTLGEKIRSHGTHVCADDLIRTGEALVRAAADFDIAALSKIVHLLADALGREIASEQEK